MIKTSIVALIWTILAFGMQSQAKAEHIALGSENKIILGWIEKVVLKPWDIILKAKLDTGANTSSIDAADITFFEKNDQPWVRFVYVQNKRNDKLNQEVAIERPVLRIVQIKEHFGKPQQRPVVNLEFCLHGTWFEAEFNLVDRTHFNSPVLLGRRFLQDIALVDPKAIHLNDTISLDCTPPSQDNSPASIDSQEQDMSDWIQRDQERNQLLPKSDVKKLDSQPNPSKGVETQKILISMEDKGE